MRTCETCSVADINGGTCCIRREPDDEFMDACFRPLQKDDEQKEKNEVNHD